MDSNQENINILFQSYRYITVPVKELVVIDLVSKFTLYLCIISFSEPGFCCLAADFSKFKSQEPTEKEPAPQHCLQLQLGCPQISLRSETEAKLFFAK